MTFYSYDRNIAPLSIAEKTAFIVKTGLLIDVPVVQRK